MLYRLLIIFSLPLMLTHFVFSSEIRNFRTDGCTLAPDGTVTKPQLWKECCIAHDMWYWGGGTKKERQQTDINLKLCIEKKAGPFIAKLFIIGVHLGSFSPFKIEGKRWGNAWNNRTTDYFALTIQQKKLLLKHMELIQGHSQIVDIYRKYLKQSSSAW